MRPNIRRCTIVWIVVRGTEQGLPRRRCRFEHAGDEFLGGETRRVCVPADKFPHGEYPKDAEVVKYSARQTILPSEFAQAIKNARVRRALS